MDPNLTPAPEALMESVLFEDGLAAAIDAAEAGVAGHDPTTLQLAAMKLLANNLAASVTAGEPFATDGSDPYVAVPESSVSQKELGQSGRSGPQGESVEEVALAEVDRWERLVTASHAVVNQLSAVRARGVAEFARWGATGDGAWTFGQHSMGHRDEGAADQLGPALRLGPHEADRLVDESVWTLSRTPRLWADVARGRANLATVAAVAAELQDARPETCERVEDVVLRKAVHRRATRVSARRSARTLVEGFEAAAARATTRRALAAQTGVWLDPHPMPGLALLSAALPTADAEALMTAVEKRATATHRSGGDGRLLGEHRADALVELALRHVTLTAHLDLVALDCAGRQASGSSLTGAPTTSDQTPLEMLRRAPVVLAARVGAVRGARLATVLAAHDEARASTVTLTAEQSGCGAAVGRSGDEEPPHGPYRPSKAMRDTVIRRDQHCRFPGCNRSGRYTDLDHVRPWPHGPTSPSNLQCLCRRHHRAKQRGWSVTIDSSAGCTWTSPAGRRYSTLPGRTRDVADLVEFVGGAARDRAVRDECAADPQTGCPSR